MGPVTTPSGQWMWAPIGAYFAFGVLPTIIFFSSFMAVLYHIGVMQFLVRVIAQVMQKTMKTSGSETLSAAGNIFVGQTEAPLLVRPFVKGMTESELMAIMTGGFAICWWRHGCVRRYFAGRISRHSRTSPLCLNYECSRSLGYCESYHPKVDPTKSNRCSKA